MRSNRFFCLATLISVAASPMVAQSSLRIDTLNPGEELSGCGTCFYQPSSSDAPVKQLFAVGGEDASIRINGALHQVTLRKRTETLGPNKRSTLGDTCHEVWSDGQIEVTLDYKVIGLGEENSHLKGSLKVIVGKLRKSLAVEGDSGC